MKLQKLLTYRLHIGPACANVKKRRTAKESVLIKGKSETLVKGTLAELLYLRGDAKTSDYLING